MRQRWFMSVLGAVAMLAVSGGDSPASAGRLSLGRGRARPGRQVTIAVRYHRGRGPAAAGVATDIEFDPAVLQKPTCKPGPALSGSGKALVCAEPQAGRLRLAVVGMDLGRVPNGKVGEVTFEVAPAAPRGRYRLRHRPSAADAKGRDFPLKRHNGAILVKKGRSAQKHKAGG